jgi:hypothetical protein
MATPIQPAWGAAGSRGYSRAALDRVIGLLILAFYVFAVVGLAGIVTFGVIRLFPTKDETNKPDKPSDDGTGEPQGRLFRRAKREASA